MPVTNVNPAWPVIISSRYMMCISLVFRCSQGSYFVISQSDHNDYNTPVWGLGAEQKLNLEQAAGRLKLESDMLESLLEPKEKIELTLNPTLSSDRHIQVKAFIVRHRDSLGPAKGGIRMSSSVTMDDIQGLAMGMTWKTALIFCRNTTGETRRWSYPLSSGKMYMWNIENKAIVYTTCDTIWSIGYFVSTAGINEEVIKKYIKMQGEEDSGQAKLEF
jgi:hypothetical protein